MGHYAGHELNQRVRQQEDNRFFAALCGEALAEPSKRRTAAELCREYWDHGVGPILLRRDFFGCSGASSLQGFSKTTTDCLTHREHVGGGWADWYVRLKGDGMPWLRVDAAAAVTFSPEMYDVVLATDRTLSRIMFAMSPGVTELLLV